MHCQNIVDGRCLQKEFVKNIFVKLSLLFKLLNGAPKIKLWNHTKKSIFRFLPKFSTGHGWSWKYFFANFQILGPLGCQGWVVITKWNENVKKSQNHCTLLSIHLPKTLSYTTGCSDFDFFHILRYNHPSLTP